MGYIRLRRRQFWSAGASEARPRFGSLGADFRHSQSAVAAALCRRTSKVPRVAYPVDSSVVRSRPERNKFRAPGTAAAPAEVLPRKWAFDAYEAKYPVS